MPNASNTEREDLQTTPADGGLYERLDLAGRDLSSATVMFHAAIAEHLGLSASEEEALDILLRRGPLTHSQLSKEAGLAKPTVTDLIGRLEHRGYAERRPHPEDGRRILVEARTDRINAELGPLFAPWIGQLRAIYATYSEDQLLTIAGFMERLSQAQAVAAEEISKSLRPQSDS
ncbi:MarR family transcriptional regulator [Sinomonas sp. ASV322]|uniref:MarR family winged helix-turn-helix transcriptional regulator n=1 Tax=Sinomonas sp. ASV322 TaxID=3041920 RepID=UPI0027DE939A|nr:MarR family transcriptional regulator [Sinomonas sp. ASV322]MDQ4503480.1 MarR family transcriptional regulator [Sinomonas sp. ASV322]